jgi:electron transport complex protein RnfG
MKFTKKDLKPVLVLGAICLVVAVLLAGVNMITSAKIEADKEAAIQKSLEQVMPGGSFTPATEKYNIEGTTVTAVYENVNSENEIVGWVVTLSSAKGYTGNAILLTVGINTDGVITGAVVTSNPESKGVDQTNAFFESFGGKNPEEVFDAELIAGVTYSSTAVRNAALDAFKVLGFEVPELPPVERVENITGWSYAGIAAVVVIIGLAVAYTIVKRRKGI